MTLLKDNNYKDINVALLSLEADIKNKITNFDTSVIDKQLVEINSRIDKINAGDNNTSAAINDIRYEIEDINSKLKDHSAKIENIEQKLADIFSAENKVTDFNTTTASGIYYWTTDAANRPTDYGVLLVNKHDGGSTTSIWINQIAYGTNNKIYFRQNINSGSWTEWKAVAYDGEIIAKKVANALTVNGKTYDGSEAVDAGVQKIENGGTGATTAKEAFENLANGLSEDNGPLDTEYVIYKNTAGTHWGLYTLSTVWNYIKNKISSVLGLTKDTYGGKASTAGNADTVDNYPASQLWRSDGATWNPSANVTMTPSGNDNEWSFDFRDKNGAAGLYWQVWDENKQTLLKVNADDGKVSAPYGFVGNLSGKADTAGTADRAISDANGNNIVNTYATKTDIENTTTKSVSLSTVTTGTTKYIKLGTFHWNDSFSFNCRIAGNSFEDNVNVNILGGNSSASSVCGYYSTNSGLIESIIVKRGEAWNSNFEIYLKIIQLTTANVFVTIDKRLQDRINISESTTAPSGTLEEIVFNNINGMFTSGLNVKNKLIIPIGAPSSLEDGCIWIER